MARCAIRTRSRRHCSIRRHVDRVLALDLGTGFPPDSEGTKDSAPHTATKNLNTALMGSSAGAYQTVSRRRIGQVAISTGALGVRHDDRSDDHEYSNASDEYSRQKVPHVGLVANSFERFHGSESCRIASGASVMTSTQLAGYARRDE